MAKRLVLPLPPSLNHMYRNYTTPQGRRMRVLNRDGEKWQREAARRAKAWAMENHWTVPPAKTKLALKLWYFWPDRRRTDTHNRSKLLCDTLEGVLYEDDRWVLVQEQDFTVDKHQPRVEIELEVIGEEDGGWKHQHAGS